MIIWSWKLDNYIPEFKNSNIVDMCSIPGQSLDFHILQPKKKVTTCTKKDEIKDPICHN